MRVSELKTEMDAQFGHMQTQFAQVDARFAQVDARFAQVDARFTQVDARFTELEQRIAAEGAATRVHFDVVAEALRAEIRLALDKSMATGEQIAQLIAADATRHAAFEAALLNHEARLKTLESE